jgi:pyruvate/2-oxoglutarate dehydrogenase complex dihydrolipoamide dehydrogenase (E3) component
MFTDPPFARVGMSESEARGSGKRVLMAKFEMKNVSRAKEENETAGLIKLLVDAETDRFLGFAMVGISADEILHVFTNYMAAGGTAKVMKEALPAHPTVAEFFPTILGKLKPL